MGEAITKVVTFIVLVITLSIWSIVGLVFWIPLLIRVTAIFAAMLVHSVVTNQDPAPLKEYLETACAMYPRGFRWAIESLYHFRRADSEFELRFGRIILESVWAAVVWLPLLYLFAPEFALPIIMLVNDVITLKWLDDFCSWYIGLDITWITILPIITFIIGAIIGAVLFSSSESESE